MNISGSHYNLHSKQLLLHVSPATEKKKHPTFKCIRLTGLPLSFHLLDSSPHPRSKILNSFACFKQNILVSWLLEPLPLPLSLLRYFLARSWEEDTFYLVTWVTSQEVCHLTPFKALLQLLIHLFNQTVLEARIYRTDTVHAFVELTHEQGRQWKTMTYLIITMGGALQWEQIKGWEEPIPCRIPRKSAQRKEVSFKPRFMRGSEPCEESISCGRKSRDPKERTEFIVSYNWGKAGLGIWPKPTLSSPNPSFHSADLQLGSGHPTRDHISQPT